MIILVDFVFCFADCASFAVVRVETRELLMVLPAVPVLLFTVYLAGVFDLEKLFMAPLVDGLDGLFLTVFVTRVIRLGLLVLVLRELVLRELALRFFDV